MSSHRSREDPNSAWAATAGRRRRWEYLLPALGTVLVMVLTVWAFQHTRGSGGDPPATGLSRDLSDQARDPHAVPITAAAYPVGCSPSARACADLRTQRAWLQTGGTPVYGPVPLPPGAQTGVTLPGPDSSATPEGRFHVLRKDIDAVSAEYNEDMPYAVYFAPGGIAFHQGSLGSFSHGCLHLDAADAERFFAELQIGDEVDVFESALG